MLQRVLARHGVSPIDELIDGTVVASLNSAKRHIVHTLCASEEAITDEQGLWSRAGELIIDCRKERDAGRAQPEPKAELSPTTAPLPSRRPRRGQPTGDIPKFQLNQLLKLLRRRGEPQLPDDDLSRDRLQTLLDLGLSAGKALEIAPWVGTDLADMQGMAVVGQAHWNPRTLGNRFEVTKEERLNYDLRNIECYDADRWEVQEALAAKKKERNRLWMEQSRLQKRHRESARAVTVIPPRSNAKPISEFPVGHRQVYTWLDGKGWQTIHHLACALKSDSCVGRGPDGRRLKYKAVMRKIHRWSDDLRDGGLVAEDFIPFERGAKMRRVRRFDQAD